jgi:hypothetical protein
MPAHASTPQTVVTDWYKPGKSLSAFHESPSFARFIIGGRGCGKTTSVSVEIIRHGWHNPGAKILVLRKTEISQADTTLDTFRQTYRALGDLYVQTTSSLFRSWRDGLTVRLPSAVAVQKYNEFQLTNPTKQQLEFWLDNDANMWCAWLEFRGVPDAAKRGNKLRGYECSMAVFIEADLMDREDFELTVPCLRWKNAFGQNIPDKGIIVDTNPPSPHHWIAKMEKEKTDEKDSNFQFWHIKTEENNQNLEVNYVEMLKSTYKNNPAMYKRMVLGEYAEAFDGSPVLFAFDPSLHSARDLSWPKGAYLVRGWDFGVNNAVVFSAYWEHDGTEYWWDLRESFLEDSDVDRQAREVLRITAIEFPFWNDRSICMGILDYCDPAGAARKDTGSSLEVLATHGIYPGYTTASRQRSLIKSIAAYNRLLEARDKAGAPVYQIDEQYCPKLFTASIGGYRYPKVGEPGYGKESPEPIKGPAGGNHDHIADAARYAKVNCLRLMKTDHESVAAKVGVLGKTIKVNPAKRWY